MIANQISRKHGKKWGGGRGFCKVNICYFGVVGWTFPGPL